MTNFLQSQPCSCPSTSAVLAATIAGTEIVPTCSTHQADAIAERAEAERIATITAGADALETVLDKVRHEAEERDARAAAEAQAEERDARAAAEAQAEERERRLGQLDPLAGSIARAVGAPLTDTSSMALSADAGTIAAALGMTSAD